MRAVILARVSSEDQIDNFSWDAQIRNGERYIQTNGHELVHTFQFQESSTVGKRKTFYECLDFIEGQYKAHKETILLVVETVDRLQRGFKESALLEEMIISKKLEIVFLAESMTVNADNLDEQSPIWDINILKAKWYILNLRKATKRGIKEAFTQGQVFKVPLGYRRKDGEVTLTKHAPYVATAFEMFATGNYSQVEITKYLNDNGVYSTRRGVKYKISSKRVNEMLRREFYYGVHTSKHGTFAHNYPRLITKEVFDKCQELLDSRRMKKQKSTSRIYIFSNLLNCKKCGKLINPYTAKGRYNYYRCAQKGCENFQKVVREEELNKEAESLLLSLQFSDEIKTKVVKYLKDRNDGESAYNVRLKLELQQQEETLQERQDKLLDLFLDGQIDKQTYDIKKNKLESQLNDNQKQQMDLIEAKNDAHKHIARLFDLCDRLPEIYKSSNDHEKNRILKFITSNSLLDVDKLELQAKNPFNQLVKNQENPEWLPLWNSFRTFDFSVLMPNIPRFVLEG